MCRGKWKLGLRGHRDDTAGHTLVPSLPFTPLVSVFSLYVGTEVAGTEVYGTSHTRVPTLLLSSRTYRKWKEKIPNPSKSLLFQVGRQALLLAPCSSLAPSLKQSRPVMIATSQMVTDKPSHYAASSP